MCVYPLCSHTTPPNPPLIKITDGKLMNDFTGRVRPDERRAPEGTLRTLTVALDTAQYQLDMDYVAAHPGAEDVYATFNILMRRKAKENNFKAVLESIRDVMNEDDVVVPDWLHDIFLGYGDPGAAHYANMPSEGRLATVDFVVCVFGRGWVDGWGVLRDVCRMCNVLTAIMYKYVQVYECSHPMYTHPTYTHPTYTHLTYTHRIRFLMVSM